MGIGSVILVVRKLTVPYRRANQGLWNGKKHRKAKEHNKKCWWEKEAHPSIEFPWKWVQYPQVLGNFLQAYSPTTIVVKLFEYW